MNPAEISRHDDLPVRWLLMVRHLRSCHHSSAESDLAMLVGPTSVSDAEMPKVLAEIAVRHPSWS